MMNPHEALTAALLDVLRPEIERIVEAKAIEVMRAMHLTPVEAAQGARDELIDATEVARRLGRDTSTPERVRNASRAILNLVYNQHIPAEAVTRPSPHRVMFWSNKIDEWIASGGCRKSDDELAREAEQVKERP